MDKCREAFEAWSSPNTLGEYDWILWRAAWRAALGEAAALGEKLWPQFYDSHHHQAIKAYAAAIEALK